MARRQQGEKLVGWLLLASETVDEIVPALASHKDGQIEDARQADESG